MIFYFLCIYKNISATLNMNDLHFNTFRISVDSSICTMKHCLVSETSLCDAIRWNLGNDFLSQFKPFNLVNPLLPLGVTSVFTFLPFGTVSNIWLDKSQWAVCAHIRTHLWSFSCLWIESFYVVLFTPPSKCLHTTIVLSCTRRSDCLLSFTSLHHPHLLTLAP